MRLRVASLTASASATIRTASSKSPPQIPSRAVQLARDVGALEVLAVADNVCGQAAVLLADGHGRLSRPLVLPPVVVPVGFTAFPGEIWTAPRSWVEMAYPGLAYFNEVEKGGQFAAWEEPELFSSGLRAAFRALR